MPTLSSIANLILDLHCDTVSLGLHCEGGGVDHCEALHFRVQATDPVTGRRWLHEKVFGVTHDCHSINARCEVVYRDADDEDGSCKTWHNQEFRGNKAAEAAALSLLARVAGAQASGGWAGPGKHWTESRPVYGSQAYQDEGCEAQEAQEERREAGLPC
jgi:hypothetical protein